jgi:hypothetical protein
MYAQRLHNGKSFLRFVIYLQDLVCVISSHGVLDVKEE